MWLGKTAALATSRGFLRQSAIYWKRSMLFSAVAARRAVLHQGSFGRLQRLTLPPISTRTIQHTTKQSPSSSSEFDDTKSGHQQLSSDALKESLLTEADIFKQEAILNRNRFGVLKAALIIIAGIYFGAWCAMVGAYVLEELEIFVDEDEDDD